MTLSPQDCPPLPEKVRVMVNVFTRDRTLSAEAMMWTHSVLHCLGNHPRVEDTALGFTAVGPTDLARNLALKRAKDNGYQFLLMLDDDMAPDIAVTDPMYAEVGAVPMFPLALEFALAHDGPCCVGAPYCAHPPGQEVVVMRIAEKYADQPDGGGLKLEKFSRSEASKLRGIQRVAALPTGVLLVDTRVCDILPAPWFSYEFRDPPWNTQIASTEDVVFSRNCDWLGIPQYAAWSSWAGHKKSYTTGIPRECAVDAISGPVLKAWSNGWRPKQAAVTV